MSEQGWIRLYRQIRYNGLWPNGEKYSPLEAWLDLLLSANYNGNKILIDGKMVSIARGEFITSLVKLSERWGWHRQTTRKFLAMLENEKMVVLKCTRKYTSITIVKYDFYQSECTTDSSTESTSSVQLNHHNEEIKKEKKVSKVYKYTPAHLSLAQYLLECIRKNKPDFKEPNLEQWAESIRLMEEVDKRNPEKIRAVIEWCQNDSFWKTNILSTDKLRKQFDKLELQMNQRTPAQRPSYQVSINKYKRVP